MEFDVKKAIYPNGNIRIGLNETVDFNLTIRTGLVGYNHSVTNDRDDDWTLQTGDQLKSKATVAFLIFLCTYSEAIPIKL